MTMDPLDLLEPVKALAMAAGAQIMGIYATAFAVQEKDDASPLTAADLASHRTIVAGLERLSPHIPVLSEESAGVSYAERRRWDRFWLVDPLDGTKEFIKRNGEFTVNIALIDGHQPVLGVVQAPALDLCYYAAVGRGAWRQEGSGQPRSIAVAEPAPGRPARVVGSRSHAGDSLRAFLDRLGDHELMPMGSSLKFCLVAEGRADIYPRLGPTSEWDTAAAQCVVEQAGGRVIATDGRRLAYNTKETLLNPDFLVLGGGGRDWLACLPGPG